MHGVRGGTPRTPTKVMAWEELLRADYAYRWELIIALLLDYRVDLSVLDDYEESTLNIRVALVRQGKADLI
jgi:hypothetical protein